MVADLVTQQGSVTAADLQAIMKIADTTLLPYHRSAPDITITGINIGSVAGGPVRATVAWSYKVEGGEYAADAGEGDETTLPESLMVAGTFLVRVRSDLDYRPVITWSDSGKSALGLSAAFANLPMSETYYLRPRMTSSISCSDCYTANAGGRLPGRTAISTATN